jgi:hypothetical protein
MGEVLAWLEAAHAEAARTQRNLPVSATSPTAGGESVAPAEHGAVGATTPDWVTAHSAPDGAGCLIWTGWTNLKGYGTTKIAGHTTTAHRAAWVIANGAVPDGYTVDHLCRVRNCINPDHLEAVPHRVNCHRSPLTRQSINAAKTECKRGHPFDERNTYRYPDGRRECRTCNGRRLLPKGGE